MATTVGAFIEAGWSGYDSMNEAGGSTVRGGGDAAYYGAGVLGRVDFAPVGMYAEASVRAGCAQTDFASGDLTDGLGNAASYDMGVLYYGAHAGLGMFREVGAASNLELYGKYFFAGSAGKDVTILGDPVSFKRLASHRLRAGFRLARRAPVSTPFPFTAHPYAGAAFEYEFAGEARSATYGHAIAAPSLRGGTAMAEAGVTLAPFGKNAPSSIDLGVQGYLGKREGITATIRFRWDF